MRYGGQLIKYLVLQTCIFVASNAHAETPRSAPDWLLVAQSGQTISFYKDSQGQPSLLFFWTPACDHICNRKVAELYQHAKQQNLKMYLLKTTPVWRQQPLEQVPDELQQLDNALSVSRFYGVTRQSKIVLVNQHKEIILGRQLAPNLDKEEFKQLFIELKQTLDADTKRKLEES